MPTKHVTQSHLNPKAAYILATLDANLKKMRKKACLTAVRRLKKIRPF